MFSLFNYTEIMSQKNYKLYIKSLMFYQLSQLLINAVHEKIHIFIITLQNL
jgi:hypothetical protein